jgi:uncharacterized protein YjdB
MKLYQTLLISFLAVGTMVASIGCISTGDSVDNGKAIASVVVTPEKATFTKGTTLQFTATLKYGDGTTKDVTRDSTTLWNSSDAKIVTVSSTGLASALTVGVGTVSATFNGEKGEESFAVTP